MQTITEQYGYTYDGIKEACQDGKNSLYLYQLIEDYFSNCNNKAFEGLKNYYNYKYQNNECNDNCFYFSEGNYIYCISLSKKAATKSAFKSVI